MAPTNIVIAGASFELPPWTKGDETDDGQTGTDLKRRSTLKRRRVQDAKRKRQAISDVVDTVADGVGSLLPTNDNPTGLPDNLSSESADESGDASPGSDGIDDPNSESEVEQPPPPPSSTIEAPPAETPPAAQIPPLVAQPIEALPSEDPVPEASPTPTSSTSVDIGPSATFEAPVLAPPTSSAREEIPPLSTATIGSSSSDSIFETAIFPTPLPVTQDLSITGTEVLVTETTSIATSTAIVNPGGGEEESADDSNSESEDDGIPSEDESPGFGPTTTSSGTYTTGLPETTRNPGPSSINAGPFPELMDEQRQAQYYHHRQVETALTVIGSIAGAVIVGLCIWWFLRFKKHRQARAQTIHSDNFSQFPPQQSTPPPNYNSYIKPSLTTRVFARIPFLKDRVADRTWYGIDDSYTINEKKPVEDTMMSGDGMMAYMPSKPPNTVSPWRASQRDLHLDTSTQMLNGPGMNPMAMHPAGLNPTVYSSPISQASPQSVSPQQPQQLYYTQQVVSPTTPEDDTNAYTTINTFNNTGTLNSSNEDPLAYYARSESTLSSAFGNGTYVCPTPLFKPGAEQSVRDSTITQSTVSVGSDGRPRFRTVSAWVRYQTNRVERQSQVPDMPPEQDFEMMLPDSQSPRRVDELPQGGAGYGVAR